ncbi:ABC-type glycerol-3-phosphate transport system substrate-binding protein [Lederbergia galactosidilyticus]|uniref:ABC transporter substrate-binding protein n=1 Tax=Lederbergia galactosidilytica TaxID=217031 RepID=UPI001AE96F22|nr:extracellular solute-binding protein [Lederbergia galactosidilytica]MBP1913429.1 ABC-type glycerol-3-phosphate transport system substrate-binding protein [Lederbergia galactosidilytica]
MLKFILNSRISLLFSLFLCCLFVFSGCTSKEKEEVSNDGEPEPITLKIHFGEDENFIQSFIKPAEEKYPHITFEHVEGSYEELNAAGSTPDILFHWNKGGLADVEEYELAYDMTDLIEQSGFDISRFDPNHLAEWQAAANGETWALPIMTSRFALMYNKDIFDLFGVEYPKDGMNWEEVVDLAEKVTGERNGTEYQGLYMPKHEAPIFWTVGNLVDPETDQPIWPEDEQIREYFSLYKRAYSIPGNPYIPEHWEEGGWVELFEQGKLAMAAQFFGAPNPEANINWDIATYPEPENGVPSRGWALGISATSKHKEDIMKVFDLWFSDEQLLNNTFIRGPLYVPYLHLYEDGSALEKAIERDGEIWENRNMDALYSLPVADPPQETSDYNEGAMGAIDGALYELVTEDQIDLNTLLREKYEAEQNRIKDEKGKK